MLTKNPKNPMPFYSCKNCDYSCNNKKDFYKHIVTIKHNANAMLTNANEKSPYCCSCGKSYKHSSSLSRHKKVCLNNLQIEKVDEKTAPPSNVIESNLKVDILEKQVETMTFMIKELIQKVGTTIIGNNNNLTNIQNKNEIKIFLSEKCSKALSIQDFARQLSITFDDLCEAKINNVKGITHIVEQNLKPLSFTERPMHCLKENEWYVKDGDEGWNEDNGETIIKETHKTIQKKCLTELCVNSHFSNDDDNYIKLISFGTSDLREDEKQELKKNISGLCSFN